VRLARGNVQQLGIGVIAHGRVPIR
jgi:hypothetical protein